MTATKIYALVWFLMATIAVATYAGGFFNEFTLTIFGFISTTLVFMGLVAVLPSWVDDKYSPKYYAE